MRIISRGCEAVFACILVGAISPGLHAQFLGPRDVDRLPSRPADARVAYGTAAEQFGELRVPKGSGPFPVAIVIHGGCWISTFATLRNTAAFADALRDAGVAT